MKAKSALLGHSVREVTIELYQQWLGEAARTPEKASPEAWLEAWLADADADAAAQTAPPGPTARELLEQDRDRLERK